MQKHDLTKPLRVNLQQMTCKNLQKRLRHKCCHKSHMDECDPGAPLDIVAEASARRYDDFSHWAFVQKLHLQILPNDEEHREGFDIPTDFRIGDPNVHFQAAAAKPYETSGATGKPEWASLFGFILARMSHLRFLSTVYVLVDNRDLTNLDNPEPSLQHWPAVAAWWSRRACMQGPRCDVVYFPISQASGLHLVHPCTWATPLRPARRFS